MGYPCNRLADAERGRASRVRVVEMGQRVALPVVGLVVGMEEAVVVLEVVGLIVEGERRVRDGRLVVGAGVGSVEALMGLGRVGFAGRSVSLAV